MTFPPEVETNAQSPVNLTRQKRQLAEQAIAQASAADWTEAAATNRRLLELGPDAEAENRLAKSLWELGILGEAREHYQTALALDPTNRIAERNIDRLKVLLNAAGEKTVPAQEGSKAPVSIFVEETGKTGFAFLTDLATPKELAQVNPGDAVELSSQGSEGGGARQGLAPATFQTPSSASMVRPARSSIPYGTENLCGREMEQPAARARRLRVEDGGCRRAHAAQRPEEPRSRTSTVSGGLPTSSRPFGRFWNSTGARMTRSTTRSPATTSHSNAAMQMERNFSPRLRKGWYAISRMSTRPGVACPWPPQRDQRLEPRAQAISVDVVFEIAVFDERDAAGFFRHHNRHRVVFFGDANRGAMARSQLAIEARIDGQRQKAAPPRRRDRPARSRRRHAAARWVERC